MRGPSCQLALTLKKLNLKSTCACNVEMPSFPFVEFKFSVYGLKHTHASRNAVTLVWGSLKLAPMNVGGLKLNGVISHALVPREDDQRVFHAFEESFATSVQSVRFWSTAED